MTDRLQTPYSGCGAHLSNGRMGRRLQPPSRWRRQGCRVGGAPIAPFFLQWVVGLLLLLTSQARGVSTLIGLPIDDAATREVVEGYSLARQLKTVRLIGTVKNTDWMLDRPPFSATLARHLDSSLERYHLTERQDGTYAVDDMGSLRGSVRLVAQAAERRVYFVEGEFRSLAHILKLSGSMVFTLEYRERFDGNESYVEIEPQLFLRLDNVVAHGILKVLAPLLHGIIDRRAANLTQAAQVVSRRLTKDPQGLYQEIRTWPDVRPEDLDEFRRTFHIARDGSREGG
jgi:hypothetical protein